MPIIRRRLDPATVYPTDIRYDPDTDKVQRKINGDWVDAPESDPRHATTLPPRLTSDPACDAARSVADALKGQIDQILTAIDNSGTAFTVAGIILSVFSFGVFAVFVSIALTIANAMLDAGTSALSAALTPTVFDQLTCILSCHMNSQGRITADGIAAAESDVTGQIGGLGATILNAMLSLAGEGGVNNLGAIGTSTGDCSGCECSWCYTFDFETTDGGFNLTADAFGIYSAGDGWKTQFGVGTDGNGYVILQLARAFVGNIKSVDVSVQLTASGSPGYPSNWIYVTDSVGTIITAGGTPGSAGGYVENWTGNHDVTGLTYIQISAGFHSGAVDPGGEAILKTITLRGTGDNPFGADNC